MSAWTVFAHDATAYTFSPAALKSHWSELHLGDAEPWPQDGAVRAAWALFHAGRFQQACAAGLKAGGDGITLANKAQAIYAHYLEPDPAAQLALLQEVADRAAAQVAAAPDNANAHYWQAYALGRCSQRISIAKALTLGLGPKIKAGLETTLRLAPRHADAHIALGTFHAEVIAKVGKLLALTQGADASTGLKQFQQAIKLNPGSAVARIEFARGLLMIEGNKRQAAARQLYAEAADCRARDAMEHLEVEIARAGLAG